MFTTKSTLAQVDYRNETAERLAEHPAPFLAALFIENHAHLGTGVSERALYAAAVVQAIIAKGAWLQVYEYIVEQCEKSQDPAAGLALIRIALSVQNRLTADELATLTPLLGRAAVALAA